MRRLHLRTASALATILAILIAYGTTSFLLEPEARLRLLLMTVTCLSITVFALPFNYLSRPLPIIGGMMACYLCGVASGFLFSGGFIAGIFAIMMVMALMFLFRCINPGNSIAAYLLATCDRCVTSMHWSIFFALISVACIVALIAWLFRYLVLSGAIQFRNQR